MATETDNSEHEGGLATASLPKRCAFCKANQATRCLRDMEGHTLFLCSDCNEELMWAYAIG